MKETTTLQTEAPTVVARFIGRWKRCLVALNPDLSGRRSIAELQGFERSAA